MSTHRFRPRILANMTPDPVDLVLTDYDLLRVIVANLRSEGKAAELVGCTRVCHAFYEAAVEALWSKLNTITPLWHLLASPESQSSYRKYATGQEEEYLRSVSFIRPILCLL